MMTVSSIPPSFILIIGAMFVPMFKGHAKSIFLLLLPMIAYVDLLLIPEGPSLTWQLMDFELILMQTDRMSMLFASIFIIACFIGLMFMLHQKDDIEFSAGLFYAGSALGVVFAGDLLTLFAFWEMLTFGAAFLILARRTDRAKAAAARYLLVHVVGGLVLLAGIILYSYEQNSFPVKFDHIGLSSLSTWLIFFGFGLNCAWPILHAWLSDTYPESTTGGIVFLATYTTKCAVYVLARAFAGEDLLIFIGAGMAIFPIFYAVIENDLRRVLAYSLINQVGFMVIGIGIGTHLSLNGTNAHVVSDVLFKGLLFMSLGAVMYRTGKIKATELGGLYKSMPFTCLCCMVGAASISAFPLFSGFVSKSMIMSAVAQEGYVVVWLILLFASAGVFHHAGIKIPFFTFFAHDAGHRVKEAPINMCMAMGLAAFLCIFVGAAPDLWLYKLLPFQDATYEPYTIAHVITQTQLLFFSALAFALLLLSGIYPAEIRSVNLDADLIYRKGCKIAYKTLDRTLNGIIAVTYKTVILGGVASINEYFTRAPGSLSVLFMRIVNVFITPENQDTEEAERRIHRLSKTSISPVGVTASASVIIMIILLFLSR